MITWNYHHFDLYFSWFLYTHWKRWSRVRKTYNENKKWPQRRVWNLFGANILFVKLNALLK